MKEPFITQLTQKWGATGKRVIVYNCRIEKETKKAYLIKGDRGQFWVAKSIFDNNWVDMQTHKQLHIPEYFKIQIQ